MYGVMSTSQLASRFMEQPWLTYRLVEQFLLCSTVSFCHTKTIGMHWCTCIMQLSCNANIWPHKHLSFLTGLSLLLASFPGLQSPNVVEGLVKLVRRMTSGGTSGGVALLVNCMHGTISHASRRLLDVHLTSFYVRVYQAFHRIR